MEKSKLKIIFIHGNHGSAKDHWFPYLIEKFKKLGLKVIARTFPDNILAREKYWIPFLKDVLKADKNTIIIGHSSGAVCAMRYAEKNKIYGSVLVSPNYTDLGDKEEAISGYFDKPWDWKAIRRNQTWIVQFASSDDPYIPISEARFINKKLKSQYYEFNNQRHFFPKKRFPEIFRVVKSHLRGARVI